MTFAEINKKAAIIGLCCLVYMLVSIPVLMVTNVFMHIMMAWNLFLAALPLLWAVLLQKSLLRSNKALSVILGLLWLFFFPNAPYMITDLIHLNSIIFYPPYYTTDILAWLRLIHISGGVLLGVWTGVLSFYLIHKMLIEVSNKTVAALTILIVGLLSGYGIYIGRFLRFNSWDIMQPISLLVRLINDWNPFTWKFSLLFAVYILSTYVIFFVFFHKGANNEK